MPESQNKCAGRNHTAATCRSNSRRRRLAAVLSLVCSLGLCGCSTSSSLRSLSSSGTWNDTVETLRNRSFSAKAYYRRQSCFGNQRYSKDFKAGFRAGYEAIADGKPGCLPAFPPKEYWSWEFQSAEGQSRTAAWFEGFPIGVQAAREDGLNQWSRLQSSKCGGCSSPTATGQCGCGQCGSVGSPSYPLGSMGDQIHHQAGTVESYSDSSRDQFGSNQNVPQSTETPVTRSENNLLSPFPASN
jgi:hypothetical protein